MNILYILRWLRGYVVFELYGGFSERFINLCAVNSINIWDIDINQERLSACILIKNFHKLRPTLKKCGSKLKIKNKRGLPIFLYKHKNRSGLLASLVFFIVFSIFMNQFIWLIEVKGTNTVSDEEIINIVNEFGLKHGTFAPKTDTVSISRNAVNELNGQIMWMSINIKGSKAVIEVRDYIDEHEDKQFKEPCNLIADFDGKLLSVEVLNGDREVHEGNAVKKGDLLISGVIENMDMSVHYCEARGKISALHSITDSYEYSNQNRSYHKLNGIKEKYSFNFLTLKMPPDIIKKNDAEKMLVTKNSLCFKNNILPFSVEKSVYSEKKDIVEAKYNSLLFALDEYTNGFYEKYKNTNILSIDCNLTNEHNSYMITSEIECIDFIGVQSPIYVEFYEK